MISSIDEFRIVISPEIVFEKNWVALLFYKYWNEARMGYSISSNSYTNISYKVNALLEGRWYYESKKDEYEKEKTGNGLSANYIAFGGLIGYGESYSIDSFVKVLHLVTGWQRLFGEHLYYDINLGLGYFMNKDKSKYIDPTFRIGVGYRF